MQVLRGLWFACVHAVGRLETRMFIATSMGGEQGRNTMPHCVMFQTLKPKSQGMLTVALTTYRNALNNYMHPRTDPVVIILTVSPDNSRIMLGRNVCRF